MNNETNKSSSLLEQYVKKYNKLFEGLKKGEVSKEEFEAVRWEFIISEDITDDDFDIFDHYFANIYVTYFPEACYDVADLEKLQAYKDSLTKEQLNKFMDGILPDEIYKKISG